MKKFKNTILVSALLLASTSASATVYDFALEADTNGEYGAPTIQFGNFVITAYDKSNNLAYNPYLDSGNAGLGVCQNLDGDQCKPSSDDNVTYGEVLRLDFSNEIVAMDEILFVNGNHGTTFDKDAVFELSVDNGVWNEYSLTDIFTLPNVYGTVFEFYNPNVGGGSNVSNNQQFYINRLDTGSKNIPAVPVPAAAWLFASGLLGLVGVARRKI